MTIGQRIAQKRKEMSLSQEALGEMLGVSRQSIYKWESDAALPEIDKLIALSKLFGVSVGWLLGVEDDAPPAAETAEAEPPEAEEELSEAQLKMVEEIVGRYLDAQPKPAPRKKWPWLLLGLVVLLVSFRLIDRLDQIDQQYHRVQMTVSQVQDTVNSQVTSISDRVEEILKSQNNLTAEYGTEISATVLEKNQIRFSVYAVPKTYIEGMEVKFSADNHNGGINKAAGEEGMNHKFAATLAAELTNEITLSVTFIYPDGTHETQILDTYEGLYDASLPVGDVHDHGMMFADAPDGRLEFPSHYATLILQKPDKALSEEAVVVADLQVGIFKNKKLIALATPATDPPIEGYPYETDLLYKFPELDIQLTEDDQLCAAALITDNFGRQVIIHDLPQILDTDRGHITYPTSCQVDRNPANWIF